MSLLKWLAIWAWVAMCVTASQAQETQVDMSAGGKEQAKQPEFPGERLLRAQRFAANQQYDSAIALYEQLYTAQPQETYPEYLSTLIIAKKFKEAEKLVQARMASPNPAGSIFEVDLGRVYKVAGKEAKANEQFELALKKVNGDDLLTQRVAKAFSDANLDDYAIQVYEKATRLLGNTSLYALQLANLYAKTGRLETAMDVMLSGNPGQFITPDNLKALFLQWMGDDQKKLQIGQKNLMKRLSEHPDNDYFSELLTWIYTQKNDWDGALMQMEAIDERNKETGKRLLTFARQATDAKEYETAQKAYNDVLAKGATMSLYPVAKSELVAMEYAQVKNMSAPSRGSIDSLLLQYGALLTEFPQFYASQTASDYAALAALYADSVDKGIKILQQAIKYPDTRRNMAGSFKLQLGDYYVLKGKVWDASLTYSQVDKEFKQDVMGEDARFRNARLAYFRGDFEYAQHLLGVLKASTTELIANDALFLSVQITENVEDSNFYPLTRFAHAGLLLSQNKDSLAGKLLDSISVAFPKHPLNDDILMEHAKIELKHKHFEQAISYLHDIIQKYGQDVLGDDALFMTAEIYRNNLHNNVEAKKNYEQLIIDFPGSTFIQESRRHLKEMAGQGVN